MAVPTVSQVDAIAAIGDPVLRNHRITQCYHELSHAVAACVSPGANWCTFATWASRQAGQTIRGEDLERATADVIGSPEVAALALGAVRLSVRNAGGASQDAVVAAVRRIIDPSAALRRAADAVAVGNRKVFAEIGREFARWLDSIAVGGPPDAAATTAFCDALRAGDPPDGQGRLRDAFAAYADAWRAPNDRDRAQSLLYANLLIGRHEQTRLQPEIRASLDAGLDAPAVKAELLALLLPGAWLRARVQIARLTGRPMPADVAIDSLVAVVQRRVRLALTDLLMTLDLPGGAIHLGRDVRGEFPPELRQLDHPGLGTLLAAIDQTPNATARSGATDWADLGERMHFIADLFRCSHARADLFTAPYDASQIAAMVEGRRPVVA